MVNDTKKTITKRDLDVCLPFYTTNLIFDEDDTEEMNFQLVYNNFVRGKEYRSSSLKNTPETILRLQELAKELFVPQNACLAVVGNTEGIKKKDVRRMLEKLQQSVL